MTLTEAAFWTKRFGFIVIGFLAVVFIIILFSVVGPPPPPPAQYLTATCACTPTADEFLENVLTIPSLELLPESNPSYVIQTDTGTLDYGDVDAVNVYRYTNLGQPIDSQAQAKILAKKIGFDPEEIRRPRTTEYIWYDGFSGRNLVVTARDLNFSLTTDISKIREIRKENDLPSRTEAVAIAINALRTLGRLGEAYTQYQPVTYLIDINPDGSYSKAESELDAELYRVDFQRDIPMISIRKDYVGSEKMINELTKRDLTYEMGTTVINDQKVEVYNFSRFITYQNPNKSNISVYVGPENQDLESLQNIYQIDYRTWDIESESCGTYPLIDPETAKAKIENGEGSIAFINYNNDEVAPYTPQDVRVFTITKIRLTYYEGLTEQQFLQPVYLYSGIADMKDSSRVEFFIYYPAISYDSVTNEVEVEEPEIKEEGGLLGF